MDTFEILFMLKFIEKLLGDPRAKDLKRIQLIVDKINEKESEFALLSEEVYDGILQEYKGKSFLESQEMLVDLLALTKNACRRIIGSSYDLGKKEELWGMIPFDVQLIGAIALLEGKIAEMRTGEGKTLVAAIAASVIAFEEKGVHVVTVNDYLAKRDAAWMKPLFERMGFSVGNIVHGLDKNERRKSYASDICYGTNNEFGFDYLRDNMAQRKEEMVQRGLHFAIIDEADSILIDEARTPLIISTPAEESTEKYVEYASLVQRLQKNTDYTIDEKQKTAILTEEGISTMEKLLGIDNIYTEKGFVEVHHIEQALRAIACFQKDVDYIVHPEEGIVIVDEFTGRLMPGRRYSEGLHQALEAKEKVEVRRESKTLASITFQNYFRLYSHLAGMTGTAETESEEFSNIYRLPVLPIPPNKFVIRKDVPDVVFKNEKGKLLAIVKKVKEKNMVGQPVLIGTISIERSELLSALFTKEGIPHSVLNAKHHEKEAEIISHAGEKGAVTIATNMAGRGTDIKLGEGVQDLGGLMILGSERHESRRIDNQLRGRSGRQGDPGESQFFVSLEDSLLRLFGSERLQKMMDALNVPDDLPLENNIVSIGIESAQKKIEGINFDRRKHVLQYDDVMNRHRNIIYEKRKAILTHEDLASEFLKMINQEADSIVESATAHRQPHEWDLEAIQKGLLNIYNAETLPSLQVLEKEENAEALHKIAKEYLENIYAQREKEFPSQEMAHQAERIVYLRTIDSLWMEHLESMDHLKEQVALRAYGQRDPLMEFKGDAFNMFEQLLAKIRRGTISTYFRIEVDVRLPETPVQPVKMQTNQSEIEGSLQESSFLNPVNSPASSPRRIRVAQEEGTVKNTEKVGRNDPCPCGSGKKYKKCHGKDAE
jgi:preprotein translocase subunit SecA